jgi:leucyl aminopeptidase
MSSILTEVTKANLLTNVGVLTAFTTRYSAYTVGDNAQDVADAVQTMFTTAGITELAQYERDDYDFSGIPLIFGYYDIINVIATITGTKYPKQCIVVSAHHDTLGNGGSMPEIDNLDVAAPGAQDDASGVASMVEMARILMASGYKPEYTIKFISFGGEEQGCFGSMLYIPQLLSSGYSIKANINLDGSMYNTQLPAAYKVKLYPYSADTDSYYKTALSNILVAKSGITATTTGAANSPGSDSYYFNENGCPTVWLEEDDAYTYAHSANDTIDRLDDEYGAEVTKGVLAAVAYFAGLH